MSNHALDVTIDSDARVQLATQSLKRKFVRRIGIKNGGTQDIVDAQLRVSFDPEFVHEKTLHISHIGAGETHILSESELGFSIHVDRMANLTERQDGTMSVVLEQGEQRLGEASQPIRFEAYNQWLGHDLPPESLAVFVTPNHPGLAPVLQAMREDLRQKGRSDALDGYQSKSPSRVVELTAAAFSAIQSLGIGYANPPASFHESGQKIRTVEQVLSEKLATCLDLSVLFAGVMEQCGLHPIILMQEGHAFVGVWLTDWHLPTPWNEDPLPVKKRVKLDECCVFETTLATQAASFRRACEEANAKLEDTAKFLYALDITGCRDIGITPLGLLRSSHFTAVAQLASGAPRPGESDLPTMSSRVLVDETPSARIDRWKTKLLDLTLRNRLINHKDTNAVIPLLGTMPGQIEDALSERGTLELVARPKQGTVEDLDRYVEATLKQARLAADLTPADFDKRTIELFRKNMQMIDESGVSALFLALGTLQWFESKSSQEPRFAPILLVPVTLERVKVGGPYRLVRTEDDPIWNASLFQKLLADFGIPNSFGAVPPTDERGIDVDGALRLVLDAVKDQPRFDVYWQASVAFYNFQKFMLWNDLEQNAQKLMESDVVRHIVEGSDAAFPTVSAFPDVEAMDERPAADDLSVVDADSSQLAAIFFALEGNSFVLQGPPGTGKSQTITNLIAQALAQKKTVLFVSEKRAALEVVETRLKRVGLGPFSLDAHSDKSSKADIVRQLKEPLNLDWSKTSGDWAAHADKLSEMRAGLNAHIQKFHEAGPFGESLYDVVGRLIALDAKDAPKIPIIFDKTPDRQTYERCVDLVAEFGARTQRVGAPNRHPWRFLRNDDWSVSWSQAVAHAVRRAHSAGKAWMDARDEVIGLLAPAGNLSPQAFDLLGHAAELLGECPIVPSSLLREDRDVIERLFETAVTSLGEYQRESATVEKHFSLALLDGVDLPRERQTFKSWAGVFLLSFFILFFARLRLKSFAAGKLPDNLSIGDDLVAAENAARHRQILRGIDAEAGALFGRHWHSERTDIVNLNAVWTWAKAYRTTLAGIRESSTPLAQALMDMASNSERLSPETKAGKSLRDLSHKTAAWRDDRSNLDDVMDLDEAWAGLNADQQYAVILGWTNTFESLQTWCDWLAAANSLRSCDLDELVDACIDGRVGPQNILPAYERALRDHYWKLRSDKDMNLRQFRGEQHERAIARFVELDEQAKTLARQEIQARLAARLPDRGAPGEMEILRREFGKQRGHKSIRRLFSEVPNVLLRLKPCVLMSPLSVARFLDANLQLFDIVIFDEASQIPPWDAIGAIARGKQAIIVGDSKQLPPTSFFASSGADDELEDEDRVEMESILDQAVSRGVPEMTLNWHYRSRHESLIAFSNHFYYDNRLHVFPSPHHSSPTLGLKWRHVADGVYDRGGSRSNRREGEEVVAEIMRRLLDPELREKSIGVVTFSSAQQRLIEDLMDEARRNNPHVEKFFTDEFREPIFIKNLENVQGDERDVIFFSICYGPDAAGKTTLSFGPLNRRGGERRLNVAVTRARELLIVFSTLRPDHIASSSSNPTVLQLKSFLDYAARGPQALLEVIGLDNERGFGSPFEEEVYNALQAKGWEVHTQVGVGGFFIDLAVVDPQRPGAYLLGIECDGAAYHSAKSARDRDRIRQNILENLGWRIHRIWSTDWWTHRSNEMTRLTRALEDAKLIYDKQALKDEAFSLPTRRQDTAEPVLPPVRELDAEPPPQWPSFVTAWRTPTGLKEHDPAYFYDDAAVEKIADQLQTIAAQSAPVLLSVAARYIANAWGINSTTQRVVARVSKLASGLRGVYVRDDVLWLSADQADNWKGFRHHEEETRDITDIPHKEIHEATVWLVARAVSIERGSLVSEVSRLFGYQRAGRRIQDNLHAVIDRAVEAGQLAEEDGKIRMGT